MIAKTISLYKTITDVGLTALVVILLTACRTPGPRLPDAVTVDAASNRDIARLYKILGITAKSYKFDLQPSELLLVRFHAKKNGVDEKDDTYTHEVTFPVYEKFGRGYPTYEPLIDKRVIDVEIQMPGYTWNPDLIKVSVKVPGFEKFFYLEKPKSSRTSFSPNTRITRNEKTRLLELDYKYSNGDVRTVTVEAEIESSNRHK